ncbi:hypothetical protein [Streptacidiphilus sp. PAMC 29251]
MAAVPERQQPGPAVPRRRRRALPEQPPLPLPDPGTAFEKPKKLRPVRPAESLDELARRFPDRGIALSPERGTLVFFASDEQPGAFSMDSLEFFFVIAQYFREALPLRLILLMISCQKAGGTIELTQEEMGRVLDVPRVGINEILAEVMSHGIVFKVGRGRYQFNPPYSYRAGEFIPGTETTKAEYRRVEQSDTLRKIRDDLTLPELVRYPNLNAMRTEIERVREERAATRAARRRSRESKETES